MKSKIVKYNQYDGNNLIGGEATRKDIPDFSSSNNTGNNNNNNKQNSSFYHVISLNYKYGDNVCDKLLFELCELTTTRGIVSQPNLSGKIEHTIYVRFNLSDPIHQDLIESLNRLYLDIAKVLDNNKGKVKQPHFSLLNPESVLRHIITKPIDPVTALPAVGKAPGLYLRLYRSKMNGFYDETSFIDLDGNKIPWSLLSNVEMKFIPLIHFRRIYAGTVVRLQFEMVSAVVTSVVRVSSIIRQIDTINDLKSQKPELASLLASQIALLSSENSITNTSEEATQSSTEDKEEQKDSNEATFSEISNLADNISLENKQLSLPVNNVPETKQLSLPVNNVSTIPNIPDVNRQFNLQSILSRAPPTREK